MKMLRLFGKDYTEYMQNKNGERQQIRQAAWDEFGEEHGSIRLLNPSGRIISMIRENPADLLERQSAARDEAHGEDQLEASGQMSGARLANKIESVKRAKNSGLNKAPAPKTCDCSKWPWSERPLDERSRQREHHPKCAWKRMWERQSNKIKQVTNNPLLEARHTTSEKPTNHSSPRPLLTGRGQKPVKLREVKTGKVPHPDNCPVCKTYTKGKNMEKDQHHPTCVHFKKYKAISIARKRAGIEEEKPVRKIVLIDLDEQKAVREAEPDEVREAAACLRDEGMALVVVGDASYLVMYEDGEQIQPAPASEEPEADQEEVAPSDEDEAANESDPPPAEIAPLPAAIDESGASAT